MRSIERYLLAWIMGALVLGSVVIALVSYRVTLSEMDEVYNADLKNVAEALGAYNRSGRNPDELPTKRAPERSDVPDPAEIVTITWTPDGRRVFSSDPRVAIPFMSTEALSQTRVGDEDWLVYTDVSPNGVAQAAQRFSARHAIASESAATILLPLMALGLFVAVLIVIALRRGLRPLDAAAHELAARSASSLVPIDSSDVPSEMTPLVASINALMGRLSVAFTAQRRFLADAAHELRTPTTALRLQLQLLERATDARSRAEAMAELQVGVDRSQRLIEQLLQVARSEPDGEALRLERIDLAELAQSVVGSLSVKADHRGIDLGVTVTTNVAIDGDLGQLTVLLNNLVENALRHTPEGSVVDVEVGVHEGRPVLRVIDDGPGIPTAARARVFDRFYRHGDTRAASADTSGSGLGLAIVQAIAERHGAEVSLHLPMSCPGHGHGRGLEVRVRFAVA